MYVKNPMTINCCHFLRDTLDEMNIHTLSTVSVKKIKNEW